MDDLTIDLKLFILFAQRMDFRRALYRADPLMFRRYAAECDPWRKYDYTEDE